MVSTDQIMINVFLNILNQPVKLETAKVQLQVRSNRQELLQEGKIEVSIDVKLLSGFLRQLHATSFISISR